MWALRDSYYGNDYQTFSERPLEQAGREVIKLERRVYEGATDWDPNAAVRMMSATECLYRGAEVVRPSPGRTRLKVNKRTAESTPAATAPRHRPCRASTQDEVQLLYRLPRHDFSITGRAWFEDIYAEIKRALDDFYGPSVETGGHLLVDADDPTRVLRATGPGPRVERAYDSVRIGPEEIAAFQASEPWLRSIGSWHTHPAGRTEPSKHDRWRARELAQDGWHFDVVVTRGEGGFAVAPQAAAWLTHRDDGRWVCEPVRLHLPRY